MDKYLGADSVICTEALCPTATSSALTALYHGTGIDAVDVPGNTLVEDFIETRIMVHSGTAV